MRPSMSSVGDAYDNAMAESFFSTLECELLARRRFRSQAKARMAVFSYIEGFYNSSAPSLRSWLPLTRCFRAGNRKRHVKPGLDQASTLTVHRTGAIPV